MSAMDSAISSPEIFIALVVAAHAAILAFAPFGEPLSRLIPVIH
jgi:photosystem I reaction center subunit XII